MNQSAISIQPSSITVGLIGWPVEHSRSPALHQAAFAALNLNWRYILLPTPLNQLAAVVTRIRSGELQGANVTIPHKQAVMPCLDEIDLAAQAVGAVNTIVRRDGCLIGYNTDTIGFKRALIETGIEIKDQACAVLGAGGSARAVIYVLRELGAHITVYARDVEKARVVHANCRSLSVLSEIDPATKLIVNTTPVGMSPNTDVSPWLAEVPLPTSALIFDLIYNPSCTRLMQQAGEAGLRAINGRNMLVYQGAAAFELWTGIEPPVEVMKHALVQSMKEE